jgi:hypothetical protein
VTPPTLRDALATASGRAVYGENHVVARTRPCQSCEKDADAILADPAFRAALTTAVAEALWDAEGVMADKAGLFVEGKRDEAWFAAAIVARMLGDTE